MPSSCRRRTLRLSRGVTKILGRSVDCTHVRWGRGKVLVNFTVHVKANEGAERSFLCKRKSRRGQRTGKHRSRGRHPRSLHGPAQPGDPVKGRAIVRFGRTYDYWESDVQRFVQALKTVREHNLVREVSVGIDMQRKRKVAGPRYAVWRARWVALSARILRSGGRVFRDDLMGSSFAWFLDRHRRIRLHEFRGSIPLDPTAFWEDRLSEWREDDYERYRVMRRSIRRTPGGPSAYRPPPAFRAGPVEGGLVIRGYPRDPPPPYVP